MRVDAFNFDLPEASIALRPAVPRDASRLLVIEPEAEPEFSDACAKDLAHHLRAGDVLVFNDTKVIPSRLSGRRIGRGGYEPAIEATLIERLDEATWVGLVRPGRKLAPGDRVRFGADPEVCEAEVLDATVLSKSEEGTIKLAFDVASPILDERIKLLGSLPLPPYIASKRSVDVRDADDYQTMYARHEGAVAAPTAGLHFTPSLMSSLSEAGIASVFVTLEVGPGTFLPVKAVETKAHRMHFERGVITAQAAQVLNAARATGGRIVAVGTTSLRLLETSSTKDGLIRPWSGTTNLFITPGYQFSAVDLLMTNFHLPQSTLFMLVSAFAGLDRMKRAYVHAIDAGYRFYSYGDACLLHPDRSRWR
ncbi:S-adenosylmethionine:tRNA ribosyltransferase-isomerase [Rhodoligotrophos appendicifer]|uniref:tRNA preQ1(34) S-adenosylmethionine ribosyltransferase-isomerase QueA n=1 Tax=Rhodoligotrophos appendicifer TaxID=987056 RepID=UPI0011861275|nr:tRNA preQ1(34) S-adenosylmethionine ribosyltransferase-isomerase QueA [Rhodoligotrophos appendicifer]